MVDACMAAGLSWAQYFELSTEVLEPFLQVQQDVGLPINWGVMKIRKPDDQMLVAACIHQTGEIGVFAEFHCFFPLNFVPQ